MKVQVTFYEELLGTAANNPDIHSEYIASLAPDALSKEEEVEAVGTDEVEEKSMTVFPKLEDGTPFIWDYQWKGFFKEAAGMLKRVPGTASNKMTAYKKVIDGIIFVKPRKCVLELPKGGLIGRCQRPLRASTAQGERIALANSETVPAGTSCTFEILDLTTKEYTKAIKEWLDYGDLHGTGQWRNSGKGRFKWKEVK